MNSENELIAVTAEIDADDQWDTGALGRDEVHAVAEHDEASVQEAIDKALEMQMISIRLPRGLIDDFKFLGEVNGLKYQTLMRQILARFVEAEKKQMSRKAAGAQIKAAKAAREREEREQGAEARRRVA